MVLDAGFSCCLGWGGSRRLRPVRAALGLHVRCWASGTWVVAAVASVSCPQPTCSLSAGVWPREGQWGAHVGPAAHGPHLRDGHPDRLPGQRGPHPIHVSGCWPSRRCEGTGHGDGAAACPQAGVCGPALGRVDAPGRGSHVALVERCCGWEGDGRGCAVVGWEDHMVPAGWDRGT